MRDPWKRGEDRSTVTNFDLIPRFGLLTTSGFVGIGARLRSDFWISWFSLFLSSVRSYGWIHVVSDVWMNRWVLKKFSKDVFDDLVDYVKDMTQKLQHMYVWIWKLQGENEVIIGTWEITIRREHVCKTFQEWDPSSGSDDTSSPVSMIVSLSDLRDTDFPLTEVRPLQLDTVAHGDGRTSGASVRKFQGVGNITFVLSVENNNDFRSRCEWIFGHFGTIIFFKFFEKIFKKNRGKKMSWCFDTPRGSSDLSVYRISC
jgi:hypothetical protein